MVGASPWGRGSLVGRKVRNPWEALVEVDRDGCGWVARCQGSRSLYQLPPRSATCWSTVVVIGGSLLAVGSEGAEAEEESSAGRFPEERTLDLGKASVGIRGE